MIAMKTSIHYDDHENWTLVKLVSQLDYEIIMRKRKKKDSQLVGYDFTVYQWYYNVGEDTTELSQLQTQKEETFCSRHHRHLK